MWRGVGRRCSPLFRPHTQVKHWLRSPKDKEPLSGPGVYSIPCECGKSYIGETQRHVSTRITEHIRSVKNCNTVTSAVAEHALDTDTNHYIRFDKTAILAREKFYVPRKVREAIEISRRPNFNRDGGWSISPSWKPVLKTVLPVSVDKIKSDDIVSVVCSGLFDDSTTATQPHPPQKSPTAATAAPPTISARAQRAAARASRQSQLAVARV
ncbi:hypothetical protein NE865_09544 [Phthorimaea operculella]|nr:hypothetical protein NE865_09544 [Phthorimaea operculella]